MTIEDCENAQSCRGSETTLNRAFACSSYPPQPLWTSTDAKRAITCTSREAATRQDSTGAQRPSTLSIETNAEAWANTSDAAVTVNSRDANTIRSDNAESHCILAEDGDDGSIPYDYESEMEECSQYTFSAGPYCPAATAALAAAAAPAPSVTESLRARPDTPRDASVAPLPLTPLHDPHSPQWGERQRRDCAAHLAGQHYTWQQAMKHSSGSTPDQMRYALRSFVREACCRELQAMRSQPAVSFVRMDAPFSESRSRSSMRASCLLASATSTAERKARYIQVITEHWRALEQRVEEMLAETERESLATSESHLRSIGYAINALSLFSNNPAHIIRELNMAHVEEQRRQRHDREAQLLATLETQGRLFMLPTLYAEEMEEPVPVIHVEEALRPAGRAGELTHPWQLLSPNASLYSLAPSSAPESVGELSPSLSCCTIPSEACTPTWRSAAYPPSPVPSSRTASCWRDMQPPRLPLLDLFMTAPAVVPSTVIADSEAGVPYVMPVDPSYAQHAMHRQEALARTTLADALSSPQLSSAHVSRSGGAYLPAPAGGRLQPLVLEASEDSWGSFAEEDICEHNDAMKLAEADFLMLNFDLREALATPSPATATTRATLTDG